MESKLTRRTFNGLAISAATKYSMTCPWLRGFSMNTSSKEKQWLVHPGMLHSREDLARMREGVRAKHEPILSGFEAFRIHPQSQSTYTLRGPAAVIGRNPTVNVDLFDSDANAAYQCALMWCITGDYAYARVSINILNEWASTLKAITGADAVLCASLGGFKLVNAAELIRHTDAGWDAAKIQAAAEMFRIVLLPVIRNFAPFANGNWDTAAIKCMMAIGVFCNDADVFDDALQYYLHGCGDGRLENYVYPGGQCQESGRDQQHTQLGLAHMGDACEMAWNQGLDLYSAVANRLLDGFEYTAKYNLGMEVAFAPDHDKTGKYTHQAISPRGSLRPVYEEVYNHYVHRRKMTATYTQRAAEMLRPEGAANGADHAGFGTLLYSRTAEDPTLASARAVLGALHATGSPAEVLLEWVPSNLAKTYTISRSEAENDTYRVIAAGVAEPRFVDRKVIAGQSYFYRVAPTGADQAAGQTAATAGLPRNWRQRSYGAAFPTGSTHVVADNLVVEAYGAHPFAGPDEFHFVHSSLHGDGVLTACLSPLLASQVATMGLMLRASDTADAPMVALTVCAGSGGERPQWILSILCRDNAGDHVRTIHASTLNDPMVTWGRVVQFVWLRLSRAEGELSAYFSPDGLSWLDAGKTLITNEPLLAGCFACSGLGSISAQVTFEHLTLRRP